jgi:hypothetical protein
VVGYLDQQDDPDRMADTHKLWAQIKDGLYDVMLSDVTLAEIDACH